MKTQVFIALLLWSVSIAYCQNANKNPDNSPEPERIESLRYKLSHPSDSYIIAVAHRAAWTQTIPENSMAAIQRAIDLGVDIVEIDIRMTSDQQLVLFHDKDLSPDSNGSGKVSEKTFKEVQKLYLKNAKGELTNHRIPTLKEALLLMKGKVLIYLDKTLKYRELVEKALEETGTKDQAIFYGEDAFSKSQVSHFLTDYMFIPSLEEDQKNPGAYIKNYLDNTNTVGFVVRFPVDDTPLLEAIAEIRKRGSSAWVGTMTASQAGGHWDDLAVKNPNQHWGWLIERGVNIICTNRPEPLMKYLRAKHLHD